MKEDTSHHCDPGLIKLFLSLSPEERLRSNDNTLKTIWDLRYAFKHKATSIRSQLTSKKIT